MPRENKHKKKWASLTAQRAGKDLSVEIPGPGFFGFVGFVHLFGPLSGLLVCLVFPPGLKVPNLALAEIRAAFLKRARTG